MGMKGLVICIHLNNPSESYIAWKHEAKHKTIPVLHTFRLIPTILYVYV
jgi:hypothetical protein